MCGDAKLRLTGDLCIAGPKIFERIAKREPIRIQDGEDFNDFELVLANAGKDQVLTFSQEIWIEGADVSISTDAAEDDAIGESLMLYFKDGSDRQLGLNINVHQAETLAEILSNFVAVYKAKAELGKTWNVNA